MATYTPSIEAQYGEDRDLADFIDWVFSGRMIGDILGYATAFGETAGVLAPGSTPTTYDVAEEEHPTWPGDVTPPGFEDWQSVVALTKDPSNWWETPELPWISPTAVGMGPAAEAPASVELGLPDWAAGQFADPKTFYEVYQELDESLRPWFVASLQTTHQAAQKEEEQRATALETLRDQYLSLQEQKRAWEGGIGTEITEELQRRASPEADYFGESLRSQYERELAGARTAGQRQLAGYAAGRGWGSSPLVAESQAYMTAATEAANTRLQAEIDIANQEARDRALDALARFGVARDQVSLAWENLLGGQSQQIANVEMGLDYQPLDPMLWHNVQFAREAYETELAQRDIDRAAWAEEQREDFGDILADILGFAGTGFLTSAWDIGGPAGYMALAAAAP